MFILDKKLKIRKEKLKEWNKSCFGNVQENVKKAEDNLIRIQKSIGIHGNSNYLKQQEKESLLNLDEVLNLEEAFWREKARIN